MLLAKNPYRARLLCRLTLIDLVLIFVSYFIYQIFWKYLHIVALLYCMYF